MPELPEVETVRRGLTPAMEGAVIARAQVNRPDLRWPFPDRMAERLTGARVNQLRRRSKYILADLDTGESLLIHLGMSGRIFIIFDGYNDVNLRAVREAWKIWRQTDHELSYFEQDDEKGWVKKF